MALRLTTEEIVLRFKDIHGDRYDYSLLSYKNYNTKVKIVCLKHGVFEQRVNNHLDGKGCPKCGGKGRNIEDFIREAKEKHNNKYDYSETRITRFNDKALIKCRKHGIFKQSPSVHLQGTGCPKCKGETLSKHFSYTTEQFIERARKVHGDRYGYDYVDYKSNRTKIKIECFKHGIFEQYPHGHLKGSGCVKCANESVHLYTGYTQEDVIKIFKEIHGDKYGYLSVYYKGSKTKVKIKCNLHGYFYQTPNEHISGCGCPKCGFDKIRKKAKEKPKGWSVTHWEGAAKMSNNFDSFKVYIIKCWNDDEIFYKIGRTFKTTKGRFRSKKNMPYNYEVLKEFKFNDARDAFDKEIELKRLNKNYKYTPNISFDGQYECFSNKPIF